MFSDRKSSERGNYSERDLELSVRGSPAPIHPQQPKIFKEHKVVKRAVKGRRTEFPFPVDKIIYLAERLEVTSLTEKKIKSVSLSAVDVKTDSLADVDKEFFSCTNSDGKRYDRSFSPEFDFSLDLSSISTGDASDEGGPDDLGKQYLSFNGQTTSDVLRAQKATEKTSGEGECLCRSSEPKGGLTRSPRQSRSRRSCDSINYYMSAVENDKDLLRYFRPCRTCQEFNCVCPDSPASKSGRSLQASDDVEACGFYKANKAIETDVNLTGFTCDCSARPTPTPALCPPECCCPEVPETDFCQGEDCLCEFRDRCCCVPLEAAASDRNLDYTSSLASAARSARVLARDLERILSTLNNADE